MKISIHRLLISTLQVVSITGFVLAPQAFSQPQSTTTAETRERYNPAVLKLI